MSADQMHATTTLSRGRKQVWFFAGKSPRLIERQTPIRGHRHQLVPGTRKRASRRPRLLHKSGQYSVVREASAGASQTLASFIIAKRVWISCVSSTGATAWAKSCRSSRPRQVHAIPAGCRPVTRQRARLVAEQVRTPGAGARAGGFESVRRINVKEEQRVWTPPPNTVLTEVAQNWAPGQINQH